MRSAFKVQLAILGIYLVAAASAFSLWWIWFGSGNSEGAGTLAWKLAAIYATPLGLISGSMFSRTRSRSIEQNLAIVAVVLVALWNVVVLAILGAAETARFAFLTDTGDTLEKAAVIANCLTAGALAAIFGLAE